MPDKEEMFRKHLKTRQIINKDQLYKTIFQITGISPIESFTNPSKAGIL